MTSTKHVTKVLCAVLGGAGALSAGAATISACSSSEDETTLTREQLLDPNTCKGCHEQHFREWSGSMHAYAAEDPVFLAMNARFQRESNGAPGTRDFCVKCHAPLAVQEGATEDGLNLAEVPSHLKGITCYFCHNVTEVEGTHNNPLKLANDTTMRGPIGDPVKNGVHRSAYSSLLAGKRTESSNLCGACHDIKTLRGAHIERTFLEWQGSVFSKEVDPADPTSPTGNTCNQCHMQPAGEGPIATGVQGVRQRTIHKHTFAGIDVALTPWPEMEEQKKEIQYKLDVESLQTALCVANVAGGAQVNVILHTLSGHSFPSGAVSDRRVWVEVVAYRGGEVIFDSGVVPEGSAVAKVSRDDDPDLLLLRDCHFDETGKETHQFGHAARYETRLLEANTTFVPTDPAYYRVNYVRNYPYDAGRVIVGNPDRVTMRVLFRPIGLEVLDELIESGDLTPDIRSRIPTFQVGPVTEWTPDAARAAGLEFGSRGPRFQCVTATNAPQIVASDKTPIANSDTCR